MLSRLRCCHSPIASCLRSRPKMGGMRDTRSSARARPPSRTRNALTAYGRNNVSQRTAADASDTAYLELWLVGLMLTLATVLPDSALRHRTLRVATLLLVVGGL